MIILKMTAKQPFSLESKDYFRSLA